VAEVIDPRELELPDLGRLRLVDPQTGRQLQVETGRPAIRRRYAEAAGRLRQSHVDLCRATGAGHVVLRTDHDWLQDLATYLGRRRRTRGVVR
jgi:uncharacterized protein (DUF58 family)